MSLDWLPNTSQGVMVADYISSIFVDGVAKPVFAVANPPTGGLFDEAIYTTERPFGGLGQLQRAQQATAGVNPRAAQAPAGPIPAR
jgi:hypothetical protein